MNSARSSRTWAAYRMARPSLEISRLAHGVPMLSGASAGREIVQRSGDAMLTGTLLNVIHAMAAASAAPPANAPMLHPTAAREGAAAAIGAVDTSPAD